MITLHRLFAVGCLLLICTAGFAQNGGATSQPSTQPNSPYAEIITKAIERGQQDIRERLASSRQSLDAIAEKLQASRVAAVTRSGRGEFQRNERGKLFVVFSSQEQKRETIQKCEYEVSTTKDTIARLEASTALSTQIEPSMIGRCGIIGGVRVLSVVGRQRIICDVGYVGQWEGAIIDNVDTSQIVDGTTFPYFGPVVVLGTTQYTTVAGAARTVWHLRKIGPEDLPKK